MWTHQESDAHVVPSASRSWLLRAVFARERGHARGRCLERAGFPLWHVWITAVADWPACLSKSRTRRLLVGNSPRERLAGHSLKRTEASARSARRGARAA